MLVLGRGVLGCVRKQADSMEVKGTESFKRTMTRSQHPHSRSYIYNFRSRDSIASFWTPQASGMCVMQRKTFGQNPHTHKVNIMNKDHDVSRPWEETKQATFFHDL